MRIKLDVGFEPYSATLSVLYHDRNNKTIMHTGVTKVSTDTHDTLFEDTRYFCDASPLASGKERIDATDMIRYEKYINGM